MKEDLPSAFYTKMLEIKDELILDLRIYTFEKQCFEANSFRQKMFYELPKKFRYLIHTTIEKK